MTTGALSLDDLQESSSNDGSSTDSDNNDSSADTDELREVCEEIGADYDHAIAYVNEHGQKDDLVEFAERLRDDDELWDAMVQYRMGNGVNRIIYNHLRSHEKSFTTYTGAFYGDSDTPSEGTYNYVQQQAREVDGNLMFYQALFPEPVADRWDSPPVCWREYDDIGYADDQQDTHIYVPKSFVDEYGDYTIEVAGKARPRPPANDEIGGDSGGSSGDDADGLPFQPRDYTVEDIRNELVSLRENDAGPDVFGALLNAEQSNKDRKTAKEAIETAKRKAMDAQSDDSGSDDESSAAKAGEANSAGVQMDPDTIIELQDEHGWSKNDLLKLGDVDGDKVLKLCESDWSPEEVLEFYG
jgi:hypothetical protein